MKAIHRQFQNALDEEDVTQAKVFLYYHKAKINLDKKDPVNDGKTFLHCFCERGSLSVVRLLVNHGASIELGDDIGNTALHYACLGNHFELARFLLNACANVFATNSSGKTPSEMTTEPSVKILIEMAMSLKSGTNQIMTLGRMRKPKQQQQNQIRGRTAEDLHTTATTVKKIPSFHKIRRGSSGSPGRFRIKKVNSLTVGKESPRKNNIDAKWSDLQALRRSASEADLYQNEETSPVEGENGDGKLQIKKVNNSNKINLIGLNIT